MRSHCEYIEGMRRSFLFIATVSLTPSLSIGCCAQERATADTTQMSREEWQAHVKASRERLGLIRREGKSLVAPPPTQDEIDEAASKRVLEHDFAPAISCRPKQGYSDFEDHQIESENPRTSNGSAEVVLTAPQHDWRVRQPF